MNIKSSMRNWKTTEHHILFNIQVFWYITFSHQVCIFHKHCTAFIFRVRRTKGAFCCNACPYEEALQSSKTSKTTCTMTQCRFSKDWNLHPYRYANFKFGITFSTYIMLPILCKNKHDNSKYIYTIL